MSNAKIKLTVNFEAKNFKKGIGEMKKDLESLSKIASRVSSDISKSFNKAYSDMSKASSKSVKEFEKNERAKVRAANKAAKDIVSAARKGATGAIKEARRQHDTINPIYQRQAKSAEAAYQRITKAAQRSANASITAARRAASAQVTPRAQRQTGNNIGAVTAAQQARLTQQTQAQTQRLQAQADRDRIKQQAQAAMQQQRLQVQTAMQQQRLASQSAMQQQRLDSQRMSQMRNSINQQQRLQAQAAMQQQRLANQSAMQQQRLASQQLMQQQRLQAQAAAQRQRQIQQTQAAAQRAAQQSRATAQSQIASVSKSMTSFVSSTKAKLSTMKTFAAGMFVGIATSAAAALIGFGENNMVKVAMSYEASLNRINFLFGENAQAMKQWVRENAQSLGFSQQELSKYVATFATLMSSLTANSSQTADASKTLAMMASNIAMQTGRSIDDVMERLRSGLLGETDAIEDLGININLATLEMTDAFKRIAGDASWAQLDGNAQRAIIYFAMLEQYARNYGDAAEDTVISRHMDLIASLKELKTALGEAFTPIYYAILPGLISMVQWMIKATAVVGQFTRALFGIPKGQKETLTSNDKKNTQAGKSQSLKLNDTSSTQATDAQASSLSDVSKNADKASKSVDKLGKKTKKAAEEARSGQASFDFLNIMNSTKTSTSDDSSEIKTPEVETPKVSEVKATSPEFDASSYDFTGGLEQSTGDEDTFDWWGKMNEDPSPKMMKVVKKIKSIYKDVKEFILKTWDTVQEEWGKFKEDPSGYIREKIEKMKMFIKIKLDDLQGYLKKKAKEMPLSAKLLVAGIAGAFVIKKIAGILGLGLVITKIGEAIGGLSKTVGKLKNVGSIFSRAGGSAGILSRALTGLRTAFTALTGPVGLAILAITLLVSSFVKLYKNNDEFKAKMDETWEGIKEVFGKINKEIIQPIVELIKETLVWLWDETIAPLKDDLAELFNGFTELTKPLFEGIADIVKYVTDNWDKISGKIKLHILPTIVTIETTIKVIAKVVSNVLGSIFRTIGKVLGDIGEILYGAIDFIKGVFTGDMKKAGEGLKKMFKGLLKGIGNILIGIVNTVIGAVNGMLGGVVSGISSAIKLINKMNIDIPDWVPGFGGKKLHFEVSTLKAPQIPEIPMLAKGGLIPPNNPRQVIVGDNTREDEIVSPVSTMEKATQRALLDSGLLSSNDRVARLLEQLISVVAQGQQQQIIIDGDVLGSIQKRQQRKSNFKNG